MMFSVRVFAVGSVIAFWTSSAQAAPAPGCFLLPAKLGDDAITSFLSSPSDLLTLNPTSSLAMATSVRSLAGSSADALDPILGLVGSANPQQVAAIGAGLARTTRACTATNLPYATQIQEKVALLNNEALTTAYLAALNDIQTAALGAAGAGGAGAGGIGGGGVAGGGSGGLGGNESVANSSPTSGSSSSSSRFFASRSAGGTTVIVVSPN